MKTRTASSDYILGNPRAVPLPKDETAVDIDKPHQRINLQPMHGEDRYVLWQPEWETGPTNL